MADTPPASGGFLSPPASSVVSSTSGTTSTLPRPRATPLRPGGNKESAFIRYADQQLQHIQRRFAKRIDPSSTIRDDDHKEKSGGWEIDTGYTSMKEVCRDLQELVDVVWVSGSPTLQVPYLISIGLLVSTMVQNMPPTPRSLFKLLGKLDHAFASLLQARDVETGEGLPGFAGGRGISGTEKVRIRSLVERTRLDVIEAFKKGEFEQDEQDEDEGKMDTDTEGELILEGDDYEPPEMDDSNDMQLARVYDRTIVELGDSLQEPDIGIVTERRG